MKKQCIITGGAGGIGRHLAVAFQAAGYEVTVWDLAQGAGLPLGVRYFSVDVRDEIAVRSAFDDAAARPGAVQVLINNAALAHFHKPVWEMSMAEWDHVQAVNVRGAFLCCREFLRIHAEHRASQTYGRIINIASTRWAQNEAHWEAYGASKGGLVALTQSLAVSLGDWPVTVNAVSPGWIVVGETEELSAADHRQHPSGRVGRPRDISNACLFLAHPDNDFINGHNLVVDGGMSKKMIYV